MSAEGDALPLWMMFEQEPEQEPEPSVMRTCASCGYKVSDGVERLGQFFCCGPGCKGSMDHLVDSFEDLKAHLTLLKELKEVEESGRLAHERILFEIRKDCCPEARKPCRSCRRQIDGTFPNYLEPFGKEVEALEHRILNKFDVCTPPFEHFKEFYSDKVICLLHDVLCAQQAFNKIVVRPGCNCSWTKPCKRCLQMSKGTEEVKRLNIRRLALETFRSEGRAPAPPHEAASRRGRADCSCRVGPLSHGRAAPELCVSRVLSDVGSCPVFLSGVPRLSDTSQDIHRKVFSIVK